MQYREDKTGTEKTKKEYLEGIEQLIRQREKEAETRRTSFCRHIFETPEEYREKLRKILGWPLNGERAAEIPKAKTETLFAEAGYTAYRMQLEILPGLYMTGVFFKAMDEGRKPLVIVQHGLLGTPELIAGFYGNTANYNDMLARVKAHGVHVFAPQLLLWDEEYNVPFDRKEIDGRLKRVGSSIAAVEIYGISKILDYFETQDFVSGFGMVGLSYGGFYTLYTAALDTRIRAAYACSFFNKRDAVPRSDWTWFAAAEFMDDAEAACLVYPRNLYVAIGNRDALFDCKYSIESYERVQNLWGKDKMDWMKFHVFEGDHEFCKDDRFIEDLIQKLCE